MTATPAGSTRAQRAVLAGLADVSSFASAQEIHARLRANGESVGLTSVYRALQSLSEAGQVDLLRTDAGEATYRRCGSVHHHHLVCRHCGAAIEIEAPQLERWLAGVAAAHDFQVDDHTVEIRGACSRCAMA